MQYQDRFGFDSALGGPGSENTKKVEQVFILFLFNEFDMAHIS